MEVVVANLHHLHPKIDFLKLQAEATAPESMIHIYLFAGGEISSSELAECKSRLQALTPSTVKILSESEYSKSAPSNVKKIGIILESNIIFEQDFLKNVLLTFENTDTFALYSDFFQITEDGQLEKKLPAWSPIRFEGVDYLGPVLAFDFGIFSTSNIGSEVNRKNIIHSAQANDLRISRIPTGLYKCKAGINEKKSAEKDFPVSESVSIVIPTQGLATANGSLLEKCAEGLVKQVEVTSIELIVVADKGYDEGVVSRIKEMLPRNFLFKFIEFNESFNFSKKCNFGASEATGEVIIFLNDDIELKSIDAIAKLSSWSLMDGIGAVGSQLKFADGSIQHAGITLNDVKPRNSYLDQFPRTTDFGDLEITHEVSGVTGACLVLSKENFEKSGGWNEDLSNSYNDVDICLRLNKLGYQSIVLNNLEIVHNESSSRNAEFALDAFETLKNLWSDELNSERYLRSAEANGSYTGPWGSHHSERSDFTGNSLGYAWHLFSSQGIGKLLKAIFQRLSGKTNRVLLLSKKECL
jgi:GT2 family glycosyltransferase